LSESKLPLCGSVSLAVCRSEGDHCDSYRMPRVGEPAQGTFQFYFFTSILGHAKGRYTEITSGVWAENEPAIPTPLLPHVLAEIEKWKIEHSPKTENPPTAYSHENKGSPDSMIAWLRRDGSALATDAADEIERLRGWLAEMHERAARNGWHIYSCVAHDALNGKPVPERRKA